MLCICEFHENWPREDHTFRMGINEIFIYSCSEILDILKEKNASISCMYMRNYTICSLVPVGMVVYNCEQRFVS